MGKEDKKQSRDGYHPVKRNLKRINSLQAFADEHLIEVFGKDGVYALEEEDYISFTNSVKEELKRLYKYFDHNISNFSISLPAQKSLNYTLKKLMPLHKNSALLKELLKEKDAILNNPLLKFEKPSDNETILLEIMQESIMQNNLMHENEKEELKNLGIFLSNNQMDLEQKLGSIGEIILFDDENLFSGLGSNDVSVSFCADYLHEIENNERLNEIRENIIYEMLHKAAVFKACMSTEGTLSEHDFSFDETNAKNKELILDNIDTLSIFAVITVGEHTSCLAKKFLMSKFEEIFSTESSLTSENQDPFVTIKDNKYMVKFLHSDLGIKDFLSEVDMNKFDNEDEHIDFIYFTKIFEHVVVEYITWEYKKSNLDTFFSERFEKHLEKVLNPFKKKPDYRLRYKLSRDLLSIMQKVTRSLAHYPKLYDTYADKIAQSLNPDIVAAE